jgi:hypothetical protein
MDKYDVRQQFKELYAPRARGFDVVTVPHHGIYLNDARRTPPEKLRTILRQPVRRR